MRKILCLALPAVVTATLLAAGRWASAAEATLPSIDSRFASADVEEAPSFQKHVVPLFGRLGCNGRACHGSFQGQGGFQLSLFGYDFEADHGALLDEESSRVDVEAPLESLILNKPTDEDMHEGGLRYERDSWQYHVFRRWIEEGAAFDKQRVEKLVRLEVTPSEIQFSSADQSVQLSAVAVWEDGTREDVTPLCRFQSNDDQIAKIDENGQVTSAEKGDTHVVVFYDNGVVPVPVVRPVSELVGDKYPDVPVPTQVDRLVVDKLRKLGVVPSDLCSDAEFLRRLRLDITGTLPTVQEVEAFVADESADKRARKIEELLETPAYAAWWTTRLCDFTGNNDDQLRNTTPTQSGSQDWYDWIHKRVAENTPYDQLVAGIVEATSRQSDQSYREYCEMMSSIYDRDSDQSYAELPSMPLYWARRDFREPEARAIGFAYAFMGIRIQCAQCHKHPFDQWSKEDFHLFKNFFSGVATANNGAGADARKDYNQLIKDLGLKEQRGGQLRRELGRLARQGKVVPYPEIYVGQPRASREYRDVPADNARLLGGDSYDIGRHEDPRQLVMEWLRDKDNRFFATAFVNRVWASYFHVGIVNPPDDNSLANPPSNKPLLDYLAQGFIESGFDMKWVHRTIANSRTYQLSWLANDTNQHDQRNFSRAVPRRLPAEVAYDAIQMATASDEHVAQMQTDMNTRAIAIAGASSRYAGRGDRDKMFALSVFGRSTRESNCDCDRSEEASLLQTVFLQNDRSVLDMLEVDDGTWLDQVSAQLSPPKAAPDDKTARRLAGLEKQVQQLEARLKSLRENDSNAAAEKLEERLATLNEEVRKLTPREEKVQVEAPNVEQLVRQAYLRTLSRYPDESELARSRVYVDQADGTIAGLRDLMWALLNTKEFIVNH